MIKDFVQWHKLKAQLNQRSDSPTYQQQEIWWCSVGTNIGHEMDGKSHLFSRPVLVVRKFNAHIFLGVPLTTRIKDNRYYFKIDFKSKTQCVMIAQIRVWESRRMIEKMGKLSDSQFNAVRTAIKNMI